MYIGPARNIDEVMSARNLAVRIFQPLADKSIGEMSEFKRFLWDDSINLNKNHIVVMVSEKCAVVGVVRLVFRQLHCGNDNFSCAGITSVCLDEKYRKKGFSAKLLNTALEHAKALGCETVLLFARRALDHFYTQFDIWGLSSYNLIKVSVPTSFNFEPDKITFGDITQSDISLLQQWHISTYRNCFGYIVRSQKDWLFLIEKVNRQNVKLRTIEYCSKTIGYVAVDGDSVIELALDFSCDHDWNSIIYLLAKRSEYCIMQLPESHPIVSKLDHLDVTIAYRQCKYGGHMLGVLNVSKLCRKLEEKIKYHAKRLGLSPRVEHIDGFILEWNGTEAFVQRIEPNTQLGLETTARLLSIRLAASSQENSFVSCEALNVSVLDHF